MLRTSPGVSPGDALFHFGTLPVPAGVMLSESAFKTRAGLQTLLGFDYVKPGRFAGKRHKICVS
jgi:hypothetical protein